MRLTVLTVAVAAALTLAAAPAPAPAEAEIGYHTFFQDPGATPGQDFSLERHAIELIAATPPGEQLRFTLRDFNRQPVADALIAAHDRGVDVRGVIDGGERTKPVVQALQAALGADRFVICGSPSFAFNSCIANSITPGLQHNKFLTFSRLADGREDVVLETSENWLEPSQYSYYNDMVEIDGDHRLYEGLVQYVGDLQAQVRSDDHFLVLTGDDGRNTAFLSPRRQPDADTDDTIVDRLDEIDCSAGGSPTGRGLIRVANMAFRSERLVIARKLAALRRDGCDVEVITSTADADVLARLASAGVGVHPFFLKAIAGTRPQVLVHDKVFLVDARSTLTGRRTRIAYAGTSNWRGDEQDSDDLLLRIADDRVYAAYGAYWDLIRSRVASDQPNPATEAVVPRSALTVVPEPGPSGWTRTAPTLRIAASDGTNTSTTGVKRLHIELSGAQTGTVDATEATEGTVVREQPVTAEGATTATFWAEDQRGNLEPPNTAEVRFDGTAPAIAGLPDHCRLWPPDGRLVQVAEVTAADALSGLADLRIRVYGLPRVRPGDVVISGGSVFLRARLGRHGLPRIYRVVVRAADAAGNRARAAATCVVRLPWRP